MGETILHVTDTMEWGLSTLILSVAGVIVIASLIVLCSKCRQNDRTRRSERCQKPKIEVVIVEANEDKEDLSSSINDVSEVSKPESTPPTSTDSDNSACVQSDDVEPDRQETVSTEDPTQDIAELPPETLSYSYDIESSCNTNISPYICMDRPSRSIRKCNTFCGAPSKPYIVDDFVDSELPHLPKECLSSTSRTIYVNKPIPTEHSFLSTDKDDSEVAMVPTDRHEKAKTLGSFPVPKARKSLVDTQPTQISLHRKVLTDGIDLDDSLSESYEDMSKLSLFRSSHSVNSEGWAVDDLQRVSTSRPTSYTDSFHV